MCGVHAQISTINWISAANLKTTSLAVQRKENGGARAMRFLKKRGNSVFGTDLDESSARLETFRSACRPTCTSCPTTFARQMCGDSSTSHHTFPIRAVRVSSKSAERTRPQLFARQARQAREARQARQTRRARCFAGSSTSLTEKRFFNSTDVF